MKKLKTILVLFFLTFTIPVTAEPNLVLGENIKIGMELREVFKLLGPPETLLTTRGTGKESDSITLKYSGVGLLLHVISGTSKIEVVEAQKSFQGKFASGLTLGSEYKKLFEIYGLPKSLSSNIARYSDLGLQFVINNERVFSATLFNKASKHLLVRQIISK
jgi:hypothetical protein